MGEKFIMKLSTYIKSNSIKIISILLCLTIFLMLFGVGCSAKKDGDIEVQATVTNIERGYDKFERKKYERHFVTYTANGKTYTSILNGDVSDLKIGDISTNAKSILCSYNWNSIFSDYRLYNNSYTP